MLNHQSMNDMQLEPGKSSTGLAKVSLKSGPYILQKQECTKKIPLVNNGSSVMLVNEHSGEIAHSKWNPTKRILATGGNGDSWVDLWDMT